MLGVDRYIYRYDITQMESMKTERQLGKMKKLLKYRFLDQSTTVLCFDVTDIIDAFQGFNDFWRDFLV